MGAGDRLGRTWCGTGLVTNGARGRVLAEGHRVFKHPFSEVRPCPPASRPDVGPWEVFGSLRLAGWLPSDSHRFGRWALEMPLKATPHVSLIKGPGGRSGRLSLSPFVSCPSSAFSSRSSLLFETLRSDRPGANCWWPRSPFVHVTVPFCLRVAGCVECGLGVRRGRSSWDPAAPTQPPRDPWEFREQALAAP